jgi:hypothetical protein
MNTIVMKKILIDKSAEDIIPLLIKSKMNYSVLKDEIVETPHSAPLLITRDKNIENHLDKTFDALIIPSFVNDKVVQNIKNWIVFLPRRGVGVLYQMEQTRSKGAEYYIIPKYMIFETHEE